ncbi:hypothetical protein [Polaribacter sp.]|uniref:hypothetical protein n=1 Tax=Polaribacter sp. TaxID=1920175 RepID=UPI003F6B89C2
MNDKFELIIINTGGNKTPKTKHSDRKLKLFESDRTAVFKLLKEAYSKNKGWSEIQSVKSYFKTKYGIFCSDLIACNIIDELSNITEKRSYEKLKKIATMYYNDNYKNNIKYIKPQEFYFTKWKLTK